MRALYFPCHMCGSHDSDVITAAFLANQSFCKFQKIVICKSCGLVYKNPVIPSLNDVVYTRNSWGDGETFKSRINSLASYLSKELADAKPSTIIEVGPGPGWLSLEMKTHFPASKFILFEGSVDVAEVAQENLPSETVIPAGIDEVSIGNEVADLALVCGVDYLFPDFRKTIDRIYETISHDGYLYIERNVLVESEAYVGCPIKTKQDLFGKNALMTTWFAQEQYKQFLSIMFDVVSERSFLHDETDNHKCIIHGFLCKKKPAPNRYYSGEQSWYDQNLKTVNKLGDNIVKPPSQQRVYLSKLKKLIMG